MCTPVTTNYLVHAMCTHTGLFYYNIGNVHPRHRSKLSSIRLLAITNRNHIKTYGMNSILQPIVDDVKKLVSDVCTQEQCSTYIMGTYCIYTYICALLMVLHTSILCTYRYIAKLISTT